MSSEQYLSQEELTDKLRDLEEEVPGKDLRVYKTYGILASRLEEKSKSVFNAEDLFNEFNDVLSFLSVNEKNEDHQSLRDYGVFDHKQIGKLRETGLDIISEVFPKKFAEEYKDSSEKYEADLRVW